MHDWSLFSSHGLVLLHLADNPDQTVRELSDLLGMSERHVTRVLADLESASMLVIRRAGRRNLYRLRRGARFRHPTLQNLRLAEVVSLLSEKPPARARQRISARRGSALD